MEGRKEDANKIMYHRVCMSGSSDWAVSETNLRNKYVKIDTHSYSRIQNERAREREREREKKITKIFHRKYTAAYSTPYSHFN